MSNASARQEPIFPWDQEVPETPFWNDIDHNAGRAFFMTFSKDEISQMQFDEALTREEKYKLLRDIYCDALSKDEQKAAPLTLRQADPQRWRALKSSKCSAYCFVGDFASAEVAARDVYENSNVDADGRINKSGLSMLSYVLEQAGKYAEAEAATLECLEWINGLPKCGPNSPQALGSMRGLIKCIGKQGRYTEAEEWIKKCEKSIEEMGKTDFKKYVPEEIEALEQERKDLEEWKLRRSSKI